jgi:hypothetical protein
MTTSAQPVRIGPFTGGLNTSGDSSAIADDECAELLNFDIDIDGSLVSRPPITTYASISGSYGLRVLGIYSAADGKNWLIYTRNASNTSGYPQGTFARNIADGSQITIASFSATSMAQYLNRVWLVAPFDSDYSGGSWDGQAFTPLPAMPKGATATIYKERLFIGTGGGLNPSRVQFSNPADFTKWTGTDFFDVRNGDGQKIVLIYTFNNSIAVFKTNSTYVFAYESAPAKGQIQVVSSTIGIDNPDALAESEGVMYVMDDGRVYGITNWNWEQINVNTPFAYFNKHANRTVNNSSVSAVGNRIICRFFDYYYVFGLKTGVWSRWTSQYTFDNFILSPIDDYSTEIKTYYVGNYYRYTTDAGSDLYIFRDGYDGFTQEAFNCKVATKTISLDRPYGYKRLMWWGADVLASAPLTARVVPVAYGSPVRWKDIMNLGLKWSDRVNYTWGEPLSMSLDVTDAADITNYAGVRMFVKFIKSLRFRQVQFVLSSDVDGTTKTGPLRIFSLTAFILNKETVNKQIN